jgi:heptosyltransferase-1
LNILLLRTSALGDVVHALPVLTALRRNLPQARIAWVVEEWIAPVVVDHPDLDLVIPVRLRAWGKEPFAGSTLRGVRELRRTLRAFNPGVALDLMGNHKAGALAALSPARRRIGLARPYRREPSSALWINRGVAPRGPHAVDRMLAVLDGLDIPPEPADFGAAKLFREEPEAIRRQLAEHPEPYVLLHAGAGWANKIYPAAWWGAVARRLEASAGLRTRVAVARGEEALAQEVVAHSGGTALAVEAHDLPTLAALIRHASLVLGGDSGPTHLAHALGIPILMLMGPTDPARHGPYGAPHLALWKQLPCSFCHKRLDSTKGCLLALHPERVAERALEILGSPLAGAA